MRLLPNHRWSISAPRTLAALALMLLLSNVSSAQEPRPLARRVPATDLFFYLEFDGFDAHAKEWKASAAYKALNLTTLGVLLEDLAAQGADLAMKGKMPNPPKGTKLVQMAELIARKGFAFGANGKPPEPTTSTLVVRGGMTPEISGFFKSLEGGDAKAMKTVQKGTRKVTITSDGSSAVALIDDKGDLVATTVPNLDKVIAVLDSKQPNGSTHPIVVELAKPDGTFRPIAMAFVDPAVFGPLPPPVVALGVDGLKRVDYRWGVRDTALYSVFRLVAPSPRRGVLALFDGPTFDKATLPPLPAGVNGFTVASMSLSQIFDKFLVIVRQQMGPDGDQQVAAMQAQINQMVGVKVREDLLAKLGPKWSMYATSADAAAPGALPINVVALTELADSSKFAASLGKVLDFANAQIKAGGGPNAGKAPTPQFKKLAGTQPGYEMVFPPGSIPPGPMSALKPTILIGKKYLVIGATADAAKSGLAVAEGGAPRWKPDAVYASVLDNLPTGMVVLSVSDPRQSLPQMISGLPGMLAMANAGMANQAGPGGAPAIPIKIDVAKIPAPADLSSKLFPASMAMSVDAKGISITNRESLPSIGSPAVSGVAIALLLPAVQAAREAARRTQCVNNLKQMSLALLNYESANGKFPGNIVSKQGKPLLSWRVAILPYIEDQTLYKKFKLDEPWDSPTNKALLKEMPNVYLCPSRSNPEPGMTFYQGWSGPMSFFADPKKPTAIPNITDGTSNTITFVEAKNAVPWTKPDDMPFDPKSNAPLLGAGSNHPGGFNAAFADGSVRFIKVTIDPATLKALITINGAEIINPANF